MARTHPAALRRGFVRVDWQVSALSTYTVTASNAAGPGTTTISITVVVGLPIPSYTPATQVYLVGTAIATWAPSNAGGAATAWAINPALPAGLSFNVTNGLITGTPTVASPATTYTVTASNATGGGQTPITVTVNQPGLGPMTWKRDIAYLGGRQVGEVGATGAVKAVLTDHLGSPRLLVDPTGTVSEQKYMPFGESLTNTATMGKSAKGFTGHEQTDPSGLVYMQARFYAPMYHRFLSPDPGRDQHFEQTQSWNIYSYVRNSPILSTDPTGMMETFLDGVNRSSNMDVGMGGSSYGLTNTMATSSFYSQSAQTNTTSTKSLSSDERFLGLVAGGPGTPIPSGEGLSTVIIVGRYLDYPFYKPLSNLMHTGTIILTGDNGILSQAGPEKATGLDKAWPIEKGSLADLKNSFGKAEHSQKSVYELAKYTIPASLGTKENINNLIDKWNSKNIMYNYSGPGPNCNTYTHWLSNQLGRNPSIWLGRLPAIGWGTKVD